MTKQTHDLVVKTGEYLASNGETKSRWLTVGAVIKHDDGGTSIKLHCIPTGLPEWKGWISVFPKKPRDNQGGTDQTPSPPPRAAQGQQPTDYEPPAFDDDIPF